MTMHIYSINTVFKISHILGKIKKKLTKMSKVVIYDWGRERPWIFSTFLFLTYI